MGSLVCKRRLSQWRYSPREIRRKRIASTVHCRGRFLPRSSLDGQLTFWRNRTSALFPRSCCYSDQEYPTENNDVSLTCAALCRLHLAASRNKITQCVTSAVCSIANCNCLESPAAVICRTDPVSGLCMGLSITA